MSFEGRDRAPTLTSELERAKVGVAIVALGTGGRLAAVNRRFCEMLGYDREELLQYSLQDIGVWSEYRFDVSRAQRLIAGRIDSYGLTKSFICKDGSHLQCFVHVSLLVEQVGAPRFAIGFIRDRESALEDVACDRASIGLRQRSGGVTRDSGLDVVCACCGRHEGSPRRWRAPDEAADESRRTSSLTTHCLCPDCAERFYAIKSEDGL